jgi:hypothetical protein
MSAISPRMFIFGAPLKTPHQIQGNKYIIEQQDIIIFSSKFVDKKNQTP